MAGCHCWLVQQCPTRRNTAGQASSDHRHPAAALFTHRTGFGYTIVMADASAPHRRWLLLTPDRFVLGMLAVEAFAALSEWFGWFAFNRHKGWTMLIAVAAVGDVVGAGVPLVSRRAWRSVWRLPSSASARCSC